MTARERESESERKERYTFKGVREKNRESRSEKTL